MLGVWADDRYHRIRRRAEHRGDRRRDEGQTAEPGAFTLTNVFFIRGRVSLPVVYQAEGGWNCHPPGFGRGDRILALQWGDSVTYLGDFSGAAWRIDAVGNVLPSSDRTITINGRVPATVADILGHFGIATPDAATARPPDAWQTAIGLSLILSAAGLALRRRVSGQKGESGASQHAPAA